MLAATAVNTGREKVNQRQEKQNELGFMGMQMRFVLLRAPRSRAASFLKDVWEDG